MTDYFVVAIGPVQDFIASARRSRDLWYGSWLLSELSKAAAHTLAQRFGHQSLIFPAPNSMDELSPESDINVANKVAAIIEGDAAAVGDEIYAAIQMRLADLRTEAFSNLRSNQFNQSLAIRQIDELIEFYWASAEISDTRNYAQSRTLAERILAIRKTTRNFNQSIGATIPKSSLDGIRESVIPEDAYPERNDAVDVKAEKYEQLYLRYGAHRAEQLSGVDIAKRQGERKSNLEPSFLSTTDMAAQPLLRKVDRKEGAGAGERLLNTLKQGLSEMRKGYDMGKAPTGYRKEERGALLYEARYKEWIADDEARDKMREKLTALFKDHGLSQEGDLSPYYALLHADGDSMGKAIDAQMDVDGHRTLSQALSLFATDVIDIVKAHEGVAIYTGGDDVLAYLPLHTVLKCTFELAERFAAAMADFPTADGKTPTLSAGIAIVHHLAPLADALELARRAEKQAKSIDGKNALAITLSKRGGVDRTISGKWTHLKPRLDEMIKMARRDEIAKGTPFELQRMGRTLTGHVEPHAVVREAMRIIDRKRESHSEHPIADDVRELFRSWIVDQKIPISAIAQEQIVASVLAEAQDVADGEPTISENNESAISESREVKTE